MVWMLGLETEQVNGGQLNGYVPRVSWRKIAVTLIDRASAKISQLVKSPVAVEKGLIGSGSWWGEYRP
jgi:hypothetical protein